ncbi:hypothetical protein [Gilvibacter sediminis]|uniref:hypothetical protein n=1 Tax=Gilvibacter sediminis TaxID=379071 RepID=UPI002350C68C|nr:hypothetical protein [Gilvibacter sediminis]MDC7997034.1 hypothetical protein [Gilvibacter sediminis]
MRLKSKILGLMFLLLCFSCIEEPTQKSTAKKSTASNSGPCLEHIQNNKVNNLNISVLLDLSDRIEDNKVISKDSAYLASISEAYLDHVKSKKLIFLEDRLKLYFNPEPSNKKINEIAHELEVTFTKDSPQAEIQNTFEKYNSLPSTLYSYAQADAIEKQGYPGSDIWRFFKDHVNDYCISSCHRNILIILTDGYMYYDQTVMREKNRTSYLTPKYTKTLPLNSSDWKAKMENGDYGFIPASEGLEDLEVLVLGLDTKNPSNPYELDVLNAYWENWFKQMGIKKYKIKSTDIPSSVDKVIKDFLINAS